MVERCANCGAVRRGDTPVCVQCETPFAQQDIELALPRPAAPSPTQSHGTLMLLLLSGFVVLGVLLYLSVRGIGPFTGRIVSSGTPSAGSVQLTVEVVNEGSRAGRAKCVIERVDATTGDARQPFQFLSERVPANDTVTQPVVVQLDPGVRVTGRIDC